MTGLGYFEDPTWVVRWDVAFADFFLIAPTAIDWSPPVNPLLRCPGRGGSPSPPWRNCPPWPTSYSA